MLKECGNCGDGSGWTVWHPRSATTGKVERVWVACADCNDDERKPKPEICEACEETQPFCACGVMKGAL